MSTPDDRISGNITGHVGSPTVKGMELSQHQDNVLFAIIIPTYNRPLYLAEALDSVLEQTYDNWFAVIVNDASTLDYAEIEGNYTDPRFRFLCREVNGGCNAARNTGIDYAVSHGADYLTFLDDEDILDRDCLAEGKRMIETYPEYGWFLSNTSGERKKSSNDIPEEMEMDWIDDYAYGKALRGDKTQIVSARVLGSTRYDGRYRSSNMWPYFMPLGIRAKILAYPYRSRRKRYLDSGITKTNTRYPKTLLEVYSRFARHWFVIKHRPGKLAAYKYLLIELLKTPKRLFILLMAGIRKRISRVDGRHT